MDINFVPHFTFKDTVIKSRKIYISMIIQNIYIKNKGKCSTERKHQRSTIILSIIIIFYLHFVIVNQRGNGVDFNAYFMDVTSQITTQREPNSQYCLQEHNGVDESNLRMAFLRAISSSNNDWARWLETSCSQTPLCISVHNSAHSLGIALFTDENIDEDI